MHELTGPGYNLNLYYLKTINNITYKIYLYLKYLIRNAFIVDFLIITFVCNDK